MESLGEKFAGWMGVLSSSARVESAVEEVSKVDVSMVDEVDEVGEVGEVGEAGDVGEPGEDEVGETLLW